eukprot:scaffold4177_cov86-Cyclotella_meneghiniana.AAC.8
MGRETSEARRGAARHSPLMPYHVKITYPHLPFHFKSRTLNSYAIVDGLNGWQSGPQIIRLLGMVCYG